MTKNQVFALARRRWGASAGISEDKKAPTAEQRQAAENRRECIGETLESIETELKTLRGWLPTLLKAARFVVDVDGQEPSLSGLREPLERAERNEAMMVERSELREERDSIKTHQFRWSAYEDRRIFRHILAQADTLDDLAAKIASALSTDRGREI